MGVLSEAICILLWLLFGFPFLTNAACGATQFGITHYNDNWKWAEVAIATTPFLHFAWIAEVTRLWLVSFSLHHLHSSQNQKWKSEICKEFSKPDWYIKNRNKYGNEKYLIPRAFICYLCIVSILMVSYYIGYPRKLYFVSAGIDGMFCGMYMLSVFYMFYKVRDHFKLNDTLYFWYEIKSTAVIWFIALFVYGFSQVLYMICYYWKPYYILNLLGGIFLVFGCLIASLGPSLLSTLWIPRKIKLSRMWNIHRLKELDISVLDDFDEDSTTTEGLNEILKKEEKFELFIQWMYREFSFEAALCFIELVQWKEALIKYIQAKDKKEKKEKQEFETHYIDLLYDAVPKSSIVYVINAEPNINGIERYRQKAHLLFHKYIRPDAEFEVNISYAMRMEYTNMAETDWRMEVSEFVQVFDKVINEMFMFMRQSYTRYQSHPVDIADPSTTSRYATDPSVTSMSSVLPGSPSSPRSNDVLVN